MSAKVAQISSSQSWDGLIEAIERRRSAMKVTELATHMCFSRTIVYGWLDRGELGYFDLDGSKRLDPKEVARFLRARYVPAKLSKAA